MTDFKKSLILNGVSIAATLVVFVVFGILLRLNIIAQVTAVKNIIGQKEFLSQALENLALLNKDADNAKKYEPYVAALVPSADELVSFSADMKKLAVAQSVGINLSLNNETKPGTVDDLGSIGFEATLDGRRDAVVSFLYALEKRYYTMRIEVVDSTSQNESGDSIRAFIRGVVLYKDLSYEKN